MAWIKRNKAILWIFDYWPLLSLVGLLMIFYAVGSDGEKLPPPLPQHETSLLNIEHLTITTADNFTYHPYFGKSTPTFSKTVVAYPGLYKYLPWLYNLPPRAEQAIERTILNYLYAFLPWFAAVLQRGGLLRFVFNLKPCDADRKNN